MGEQGKPMENNEPVVFLSELRLFFFCQKWENHFWGVDTRGHV